MYFNKKIFLPTLAIVSVTLAACQDSTSPKPSQINEEEYGIKKEIPQPSVTIAVPDNPTRVEDEYINLEPIPDSEFNAMMAKNEEKLKSSNATLNKLELSEEIQNNVSISDHEYSATNSIKNSSQTELDAVNQAIQAALPALDE
jgi:hypothetical protein